MRRLITSCCEGWGGLFRAVLLPLAGNAPLLMSFLSNMHSCRTDDIKIISQAFGSLGGGESATPLRRFRPFVAGEHLFPVTFGPRPQGLFGHICIHLRQKQVTCALSSRNARQLHSRVEEPERRGETSRVSLASLTAGTRGVDLKPAVRSGTPALLDDLPSSPQDGGGA